MWESSVATHIKRVQPVLMVRDVPASIAFYSRLGFVFAFTDDPDQPRYAGIRRDGIELHLQWHDAGEWEYPNDRPTYRFVAQNIDRLLAEFHANNACPPDTAAAETPWGTYEFHILDPDGNGLQFYRES